MIGIIKYTNAIPFVAPYLLGVMPSRYSWFFGHPDELNNKMLRGELDASLVSSLFYLENREKFELISGIGIGADGPVESVCLFYPKELTSFEGVSITLDPESRTSNRILKWYLEEVLQQQPCYVTTLQPAFLLIGDRCLSFNPPPHVEKIDLAEVWRRHQRLPLPFAVLVARKECKELSNDLLQAVEWSMKHPDQAARLSSFPQERVIAYWEKLRYHFDSRYETALAKLYAIR